MGAKPHECAGRYPRRACARYSVGRFMRVDRFGLVVLMRGLGLAEFRKGGKVGRGRARNRAAPDAPPAPGLAAANVVLEHSTSEGVRSTAKRPLSPVMTSLQ